MKMTTSRPNQAASAVYNVMVPAGVAAGQSFMATHPLTGELYQTMVPAGAAPGSVLHLRFDRQYNEDARAIETQQANNKMEDPDKRQFYRRENPAFALSCTLLQMLISVLALYKTLGFRETRRDGIDEWRKLADGAEYLCPAEPLPIRFTSFVRCAQNVLQGDSSRVAWNVTFDHNSAVTEPAVCRESYYEFAVAWYEDGMFQSNLSRNVSSYLSNPLYGYGCKCASDPDEVTAIAGDNGVCKFIHKHENCGDNWHFPFLNLLRGRACPVFTRREMGGSLNVMTINLMILVCIDLIANACSAMLDGRDLYKLQTSSAEVPDVEKTCHKYCRWSVPFCHWFRRLIKALLFTFVFANLLRSHDRDLVCQAAVLGTCYSMRLGYTFRRIGRDFFAVLVAFAINVGVEFFRIIVDLCF